MSIWGPLDCQLGAPKIVNLGLLDCQLGAPKIVNLGPLLGYYRSRSVTSLLEVLQEPIWYGMMFGVLQEPTDTKCQCLGALVGWKAEKIDTTRQYLEALVGWKAEKIDRED